ncbi:hypothetical protein PoB_003463000 [Plakobranchus ocellatus]|uniref:Uncharacterized protein n=1 Tax=Plakobranchus ocellatus TaxID=259542 RepID=A0AAV4AIY2_9GAST|nr:hypothetical protein PoB_003463000 [Plakobranchus ocellatus]
MKRLFSYNFYMDSNIFKDINGREQDTLTDEKTKDGQIDAQSGNQGEEEETGADRRQDGWMTSGKQQVQNGRGRHKIGVKWKTSTEGYILQWMDKVSK